MNGNTTTYVNDLNAGLTQVLSDGTNTYLYGNDRIAQLPANDPQKADYFLGDALGSIRQMADESGTVVYTASYDPYGEVLSTNGVSQTSYGYAGEETDSYIKLINLRSRIYSPSTGTFLTRDSWQGDYNRPATLNRWEFVGENPVNYVDPSGHWEILPGYDLSDGGIYGSGQLTMPGSPLRCSGNCWMPANTAMSVFVPQMLNGVLYNDVMYETPKSYSYHNPITGMNSTSPTGPFDIKTVAEWNKYDVFQRNLLKCHMDELVVPENTNSWKTVFTHSGKSYAFNLGGIGDINDIAIAAALGMGMDDGFIPYDVTLGNSVDQNWSIALFMWTHQSELERENLDLVKIWNNAGTERDILQGTLGGIIFSTQAWGGYLAFVSRNVNIIVQQDKNMPWFYRAVIETFRVGTAVKTNRSFWYSSFVSYQSDAWKENPYVWGEIK